MNDLIYLIIQAIDIYMFIIIIRAILSWFPVNPHSAFFRVYLFLVTITEPVLGWLRNFLRRIFPGSPFDFSPIIAIVLLNILRNLLLNSLRG